MLLVRGRACGVVAGQGGEKGGRAGFSAASAVKAVLAEDNGISSSVSEISLLVKSHSHELIEPSYGEMTEPENENKSALKDTPTLPTPFSCPWMVRRIAEDDSERTGTHLRTWMNPKRHAEIMTN